MEEIYENSGTMLYRDALIAYVDTRNVERVTDFIDRLNEANHTAITVSIMGEVTARTKDEIKILKREMVTHPDLYKLI